jgi:glucan phosphoethanolaminetransferase (alkaline phosphatase superfamily)
MEIIAMIFLWPFIILAVGLVFIVLPDIFHGGMLSLLLWSLVLFVVGVFFTNRNKTASKNKEETKYQQLYLLRRTLVVFSIALLFPVFIRYTVDAFQGSLSVIVFGLIMSFGFLIWGLFVKRHSAIMVSNIAGGSIALFYLYMQIWSLGEGPRIIAAGLGLLLAVAMSIIKLREKLV